MRDLAAHPRRALGVGALEGDRHRAQRTLLIWIEDGAGEPVGKLLGDEARRQPALAEPLHGDGRRQERQVVTDAADAVAADGVVQPVRSEEHTSELQSLMRISYAVFCLKKKHRRART